MILGDAANSSSSEKGLESLITVARTSVGRADLASRNLIPSVLKLVKSSHNSSKLHCLTLSLKLLRNLCAGEISNQNAFIECNDVGILSTVLRPLAMASNPDHGLIRMGFQVLANVSLPGVGHQQAIWDKLFLVEFAVLARVRSRENIDPLCMIIYTCCNGNPVLVADLCRDSCLAVMLEILRTVSSVGFEEDWFKLLHPRICVDDIHFSVLFIILGEVNAARDGGGGELFSTEQAFLLRIVSEILNEQFAEIVVPNDFALCVLEIFKKSAASVDFNSGGAKSGLPADSAAVNALGYSLTILRDICARHRASETEDVVDVLLSAGVVELMLTLLRDLEPPAIIRKAIDQDANQEVTSSSSLKLCLYKGFRRDLVAVIGNCAYRRKHV